MEIIEIPGYTELEKLEISKRFLVPKALDQAGLPKDSVRYEDAALFEIIRHYTMESGVRSLEREIQRTARKIAQRAVSEGCAKDKAKLLSFSHEITIEGLKALLGPRKIEEPSLEATVASSRCGIVNALAWTEVGGTVLTVESTIFEGTGELILTGNLGDVMKESARAALSYIRSSADLLGIDSDRFAKANVHVHVPSGAIPKDGPSAGMAIASSLVSTLTAKPAARGFAMTGEITISGRILPIGGLKEKALAAVRRGLSDIIIPAANAKDVEELPNEVLSSLRVHFVESIDDTLALVFPSKKNRGIAHSSDRQGKAVKPSPDGPRGTRKRK
jgi:ATP-dependent Lon protease